MRNKCLGERDIYCYLRVFRCCSLIQERMVRCERGFLFGRSVGRSVDVCGISLFPCGAVSLIVWNVVSFDRDFLCFQRYILVHEHYGSTAVDYISCVKYASALILFGGGVVCAGENVNVLWFCQRHRRPEKTGRQGTRYARHLFSVLFCFFLFIFLCFYFLSLVFLFITLYQVLLVICFHCIYTCFLYLRFL